MTPASLLTWARGVGLASDGDTLRQLSRRGSSAAVHALVAPDGEVRGYLKLPASLRAARAEVRALRSVAPLLGVEVPRLLCARIAEPPVLATSPVRGGEPTDGASAQRAAHAAGLAARRLHDARHDDLDPVPLSDALQARFAAATKRLSAREGALVSAAHERWTSWASKGSSNPRRALCHRDYAPRNWLWDPAVGLGVIDFEHAGADHPWVDVVVLDEAVGGNPDVLGPFLDGYGEDPRETLEYRSLMLLRGLQTVAWAHDFGDDAYLDAGRALANRALANAVTGPD